LRNKLADRFECRFCGANWDGKDPAAIRKAGALSAFAAFFLMNAAVWGVIMLFVAVIVTAPFVELQGRRIAMAVGAAIGAAIGFWRANVARQRGTILDKPPKTGRSPISPK
jgi:hypothetical protein